MPPRPEVEFDFNLPHGIDNEKETPAIDQDPLSSAFHDAVMQDEHDCHDGQDYADISHQNAVPDHNPDSHNQNRAQHDMNYNTLEEGFSDDDDAPKAFDRSWTAHQARRSSPKKKKSPRAEDSDDEASTKSKKPRHSLFGGSTEEVEEDDLEDLFEEPPEDRLIDEAENLPETELRKHSIGNRMSSLNLDQQEREASPLEQQFNVGFQQPGDSDREGMSSRGSPAPSDGEVIIPPDTKVRLFIL